MRVVAHNGARILGGAERATILLLSGLQARGHDVLMLCNDAVVANHATATGLESKISVIGGDVSLLRAARFASTLAAEKPDAFVVGTWKKLFFASWAAKRASVKRVVARIGLESDTPRSAKYRYALRNWTDAVVVNSARTVDAFAKVDGFGPEKVHVIHNGVAPAPPPSIAEKLKRDVGIPPDALVVGTIARLATQKRLDRLIGAFAMLPPYTHCIIAGDGRERASLQRLAATLGVDRRVHFIGHRENRSEVLDAIDVFVITSDQEGMSNSMLEAMAFGIPVVSTRVSGADEALIGTDASGHAGVLTSFDVQSIAAALATLLADSRAREELGREGMRRASTLFSLDNMVDRWEEVLASPGR